MLVMDMDVITLPNSSTCPAFVVIDPWPATLRSAWPAQVYKVEFIVQAQRRRRGQILVAGIPRRSRVPASKTGPPTARSATDRPLQKWKARTRLDSRRLDSGRLDTELRLKTLIIQVEIQCPSSLPTFGILTSSLSGSMTPNFELSN